MLNTKRLRLVQPCPTKKYRQIDAGQAAHNQLKHPEARFRVHPREAKSGDLEKRYNQRQTRPQQDQIDEGAVAYFKRQSPHNRIAPDNEFKTKNGYQQTQQNRWCTEISAYQAGTTSEQDNTDQDQASTQQIPKEVQAHSFLEVEPGLTSLNCAQETDEVDP
jgi:hypothetical protein